MKLGITIVGLSVALLAGCGRSDQQHAPPQTAAARPPTGGKTLQADADLSNLSAAIGTYKSNTGRLPEQLSDLLKNAGASGWRGSRNLPKDPWGHPYIYHPGSGDSFKLLSAGPDGVEGTSDDISN